MIKTKILGNVNKNLHKKVHKNSTKESATSTLKQALARCNGVCTRYGYTPRFSMLADLDRCRSG
jgi:hypothetical protein